MTKTERKLALMNYLGFYPTEAQLPIIMSPARFRLIAGGIRGGKSRVVAEDAMAEAVDEATRKHGLVLIWLISRFYENTRKEFQYMLEATQRLGVLKQLSFPQYGPCSLLGMWQSDGRRSAVRVRTRSGKDATQVAMEAPHIIVACEPATLPYETYLRLYERVAEHRGKLLMAGTFEEAYGWYPEVFTEWQAKGAEGVSFSLPSWSNTYVFPGGYDDPEIDALKRRLSTVPGLFDARCGGVPTPPVGLVFREFSHRVHIDADRAAYVPGSPVYLCVDPSRGTNPYAVLACQTRVGDEVHVIDCIYEVGRICEEVIALCKGREADKEKGIEAIEPKPWWNDVVKRAYGGAIGHDAPDDKKRWLKLGGVSLQTKNIKEEHLIRRIQTFLHYEQGRDPSIFVHPDCRGLIKEFGLWRRNDNNKPIDRDNHALKALGYWLINKFGFVEELGPPKRTSYTQPRYRVLTPRSQRSW